MERRIATQADDPTPPSQTEGLRASVAEGSHPGSRPHADGPRAAPRARADECVPRDHQGGHAAAALWPSMGGHRLSRRRSSYRPPRRRDALVAPSAAHGAPATGASTVDLCALQGRDGLPDADRLYQSHAGASTLATALPQPSIPSGSTPRLLATAPPTSPLI
jgi:hypothetical protein